MHFYLGWGTLELHLINARYYYNNITGETSWIPTDRDPTPPWMVCKTDVGDKYFYNPETDQVCTLLLRGCD